MSAQKVILHHCQLSLKFHQQLPSAEANFKVCVSVKQNRYHILLDKSWDCCNLNTSAVILYELLQALCSTSWNLLFALLFIDYAIDPNNLSSNLDRARIFADQVNKEIGG